LNGLAPAVQAEVYGFLLEEMGFNCSNLRLPTVAPKCNADTRVETKREFISTIVPVLLRKRAKDLDVFTWATCATIVSNISLRFENLIEP
jgi:hypothetical protein